MPCEFLEAGRCKLAEAVAREHAGLDIECRPDERRCGRCLPQLSTVEGSPIPAACLGLVTPRIPREHLAAWSARAMQLSSGGPVAPVQATATPQRSRGLGDTVAKAFKAIGVDGIGKRIRTAGRQLVGKQGCGCQETQEWLNGLLPYKPKSSDAAPTHEKSDRGGP